MNSEIRMSLFADVITFQYLGYLWYIVMINLVNVVLNVCFQNTDPLVCDPGFMANPSLTDCTGSDNINIKSYHFLMTLLLSSH